MQCDTSPAAERYRNSRLSVWQPPERLNVWQWAERSVQISERETPFPGRYRIDVAPQCRGPMEAFTDRSIHTIVNVWATQSAKTLGSILLPAVYSIEQDPGPGLIVLPTEPIARSFSESRLQPIINESPDLAILKPADSDKYKLLEMHFARMSIYLVGSNSPGNLSQRPLRYIWADEVDKYPPASSREADALSLAMERTKARWNRKRTLSSTPTTPEGNIWRAFERSDRRHLMVECIHCRHPQKLIMGCPAEYEYFKGVVAEPSSGSPEDSYRLKWPKDCSISELPGRAWYECEKCGGKMDDRQLRDQGKKAKWKSSMEHNGTAGFHLNCLNVPWISLGDIAAEFLRAKRFSDELQNFYNSWLALPWDIVEQGTNAIDLKPLLEAAPDPTAYLVNTCPPGVIFLTAGIDLQEDEIWYVVRGWGIEDKSWLISYGLKPCESDSVQSIVDAVVEVMSPDYGQPLILVGIDSGWGKRTPEVYDVARIVPRLVCTKGRRSNITKEIDGRDIPVPPPKRIDRAPDGKKLRNGPLLYTPSTSFWKKWFHGRIKADPVAWFWPQGLELSKDGQVYKRHIESERETIKRNTSTGIYEKAWVVRKGYEANHLLDCEIIASVVQYIALTAASDHKLDVAEVAPMIERMKSLGFNPVPKPGETPAAKPDQAQNKRRRRRTGQHDM